MLCAVSLLASGFSKYSSALGENPYKDVSEDKWYYETVQKANELGIMTGTADDLLLLSCP